VVEIKRLIGKFKKSFKEEIDMNKKWTVMVYLGANESLSVEFLWNLKEMQEVDVGPEEQKAITVVAQYHPGQGIPTQRYVINKQSAQPGGTNGADGWLVLDTDKPFGIEEDVAIRTLLKRKKWRLEDLQEYLQGRLDDGSIQSRSESTGDPETLLRFIYWGIEKYSADRYMVVLAGHGSGADGDFLKNETSQDSLTLHELRRVFDLVSFKLGRPLDILGMDSCLMSMAEVYYQLKGNVRYLVGAEGFEPTSGWPYQRILSSFTSLSRDPRNRPSDFARKIVDDYVLYYFDYALAGLSVDQSACAVEDVLANSLTGAIKNLAPILEAKLADRATRSLVIAARYRAQSYKFDQYVDLWHFCDLLGKEFNDHDKALGVVCGQVKTAIDNIVLNSSYVGPDFQDSHGLSVYFPWNSVSRGYIDLEFANSTGWHQFIEKFTEEMGALQLVASDQITVDESPSHKTLHSGRVLQSGKTLSMGYYKAPSLVWKPPKGSHIEGHVQELQDLLTHLPGQCMKDLRHSPLVEYLGIDDEPKASPVNSIPAALRTAPVTTMAPGSGMIPRTPLLILGAVVGVLLLAGKSKTSVG
jgi:Clostripain family